MLHRKCVPFPLVRFDLPRLGGLLHCCWCWILLYRGTGSLGPLNSIDTENASSTVGPQLWLVNREPHRWAVQD